MERWGETSYAGCPSFTSRRPARRHHRPSHRTTSDRASRGNPTKHRNHHAIRHRPKIGNAPAATIAGLQGPSGIQLYSPKTAASAAALNRYLRFEAGFTPRVREVAILIT